MKKLKLTKKERRAADLTDREVRKRKRWAEQKAAQRAAKAKPAQDIPMTHQEQPEVTAVQDSAELGLDGLGYVYEDSMGNRFERPTLDSRFKRVGDIVSAAVPALTLEQRAARREEISSGYGANERPSNEINMHALFAVRHLSR